MKYTTNYSLKKPDLTDVVNIDDLNDNADIIDTQLADLTNVRMCEVYNNANISIPNATYYSIPFDTEEFDTDNMHDNVYPSRITIKTKGKYLANVGIEFPQNSNGSRTVLIRLNGSIFVAAITLDACSDSPTRILLASKILDLNINDYLEVLVSQSSGAALNVNYVADKYSPVFSVVKVGD